MTGQPKRSVKPIPEGLHTVTTYLTVPGVARVIEFIEKAFGGKLRFRMDGPGGRVAHAEMSIGDSVVMMGEPQAQFGPKPCNVHLYVTDADATYRRAIEAGGKSIRPVETQFYGDRSGGVEDPSGNVWWISTHVEDVPHEELERRMKAMAPKQQ